MSIIPPETIRVFSERTLGPGFTLDDEVAQAVARELEYKIREITQEALKFMKHSKRSKLSSEDINVALRLRNIDGIYGSCIPTDYPLKFRAVCQDLYVLEDNELELEDLFQSALLPDVPKDVSLGVHWLAVNGTQPRIYENPLPSTHLGEPCTKENGVQSFSKDKLSSIKHVLSRELQLYYEQVTNAVTAAASDPHTLKVALEHITRDAGHQQIVPYFIQFIVDQVAHNLHNVTILKALMNLAQALFDNPNLNVEPYLHQLIPAVLTCLVGRKLSQSPVEDHWQLRDYCAALIAYICNRFGDRYPNLQPRISKTLVQGFLDPKKPLTTHYGAIVGITKLGRHVTQLLLIPNLKDYIPLLKPELTSNNPVRKHEAEKCYQALLHAAVEFYREISKEEELLATSNNGEEGQKLLGCSETILYELSQLFGSDLHIENKG